MASLQGRRLLCVSGTAKKHGSVQGTVVVTTKAGVIPGFFVARTGFEPVSLW